VQLAEARTERRTPEMIIGMIASKVFPGECGEQSGGVLYTAPLQYVVPRLSKRRTISAAIAGGIFNR